MKKKSLALALVAASLLLAGCAKRVAGIKTYSATVTATAAASGDQGARLKLSGTSDAPDGTKLVLVKENGKRVATTASVAGTTAAAVKNGKYTAFVDPQALKEKAEKGDKLSYHLVAMSATPSKKAVKQVAKETSKQTSKLTFNPKMTYVEGQIKDTLGDVTVKQKSKGVFLITPTGSLKQQVVAGLTKDSSKWDQLTNQLAKLNQEISHHYRRVSLVLVNPVNSKRYLYVNVDGKEKYKATPKTTGTTSDSTKTSTSADTATTSDDDLAELNDYGDDYDVIEEYWIEVWVEYVEDYYDDDSADYDDSGDDADDYADYDDSEDDTDYDDYASDEDDSDYDDSAYDDSGDDTTADDEETYDEPADDADADY